MRRLPPLADPERPKNGLSTADDEQLRLALRIADLSTWTWNLETGEIEWAHDAETWDAAALKSTTGIASEARRFG